MRDTLDMVRDFNEAFGIEAREEPEVFVSSADARLLLPIRQHLAAAEHRAALQTTAAPTDAQRENFLRVQLLAEELGELVDAMANEDILEILDALGDLQYVLDGTFLHFGLGDLKHKAVAEIHRSNMTKGGALLGGGGKIRKGEGYEPPQFATLFSKKV